ncbi:MAG: hypothetical protein QM831_10325 [Kofleriaceae bacterium]
MWRSESVTPFWCVNCQFHRHASTLISTAFCGGVTTRMYECQPYQNKNTQMIVGITVHVISRTSLCAALGSALWPGRWRYLITK